MGGAAKPGPPVWDRIVAQYRGFPIDVASIALRGPAFNDEWLKRRDYLRDLDAQTLVLGNTRISQQGLDELAAGRDLVFLDASPPIGKVGGRALKSADR